MTSETLDEMWDYCTKLLTNPEETYLELKKEVENVEPIIQ
jgi:hypothetical protein